MDDWPMWVKLPLAVLIMAAFWALFLLPLIWTPLALIPFALIAIAVVRSFKANSRR